MINTGSNRLRDRYLGRFKQLSEINVTPLVDVSLTLLIIFLITAPLLQQGMTVDLPEAASPALERTVSDVILTIKKDGKAYLSDDEKHDYNDSALQLKLKAIFENKKQKDLFIKADTSIKYGRVVKIMSVAKKAGVERIGMITQPEKELN